MMTDPSLLQPQTAETIPDGSDPSTWGARCLAHNYHSPPPRYLELHHVIPRAWQAAWRPRTQDDAAPIWDGRTVPLCRTGHGNVHYWINRYMRHYGAALSIDAAVAAAFAGQTRIGRQEHIIAREALERFEAAGGSLAMLVSIGVWGGLYGGETA